MAGGHEHAGSFLFVSLDSLASFLLEPGDRRMKQNVERGSDLAITHPDRTLKTRKHVRTTGTLSPARGNAVRLKLGSGEARRPDLGTRVTVA